MKSVAWVLVVVMGCASSGGKRAGVAVGAFTAAAAGLAIMASAEDNSCGEDEDIFNDDRCARTTTAGTVAGGHFLAISAAAYTFATAATAGRLGG
jgi:hypothetical protein